MTSKGPAFTLLTTGLAAHLVHPCFSLLVKMETQQAPVVLHTTPQGPDLASPLHLLKFYLAPLS